ncbi:MAG: hypothetical protein R8M45_00920, partial [Ghiorsea sp.]
HGGMLTQLFKIDFSSTECPLNDLNILCTTCQGRKFESILIPIDKPYRAHPKGSGDTTSYLRLGPKTMSSIILLNSYHLFFKQRDFMILNFNTTAQLLN